MKSADNTFDKHRLPVAHRPGGTPTAQISVEIIRLTGSLLRGHLQQAFKMRTRCTHHCGSIAEFIADSVHRAAHPLAAVAIGSHGHLRFDALLFAAEGHVFKTAGQYYLQKSALCALDLRPAVGKLNAAARIRIAHGKAAIGKGALVDQSHLRRDLLWFTNKQKVTNFGPARIDQIDQHNRPDRRTDSHKNFHAFLMQRSHENSNANI
jgi:hypothetical protein